jgi:DNA polymerase-3 subunit delta'
VTIAVLPWQVNTLRELLARRDTLPHALLVYGRTGIGKVDFARAMAQSLLCEAPDHGVACGICPACKWFTDGNHPDYREVFPDALGEDAEEADEAADPDGREKKKSKEIRIEQIRALSDFMTLSTHRDGFRVLLVRPAEAMNPAAANALLKTLEEPPPRTVILLVTDSIGRLLATIKSRCQRVMAPAPTADLALSWLNGQGLSEPALALAQAGGAPLDAVAFADPEFQRLRHQFIGALADANADYLATAQAFEKGDLPSAITWLQTWVSDLALSRLTGSVRYHPDQKAAISRFATRLDLPALFRYESQLRQARRTVHHPLNARLLLEQLLLSYSQAIRPANAPPTPDRAPSQ